MQEIHLRKDYNSDEPHQTLFIKKTPSHPMELFQEWYQLVEKKNHPEEVYVMTLSTVSKDGKPKSRVVLMREFSNQGIIFFTNYESDKAKEMESHPFVSINFYWHFVARQVRIEGRVKKIDPKKSSQYFNSRPMLSQIGAVVSKQSRVLKQREQFLNEIKIYQESLKNQEVIRPDFWGGYIVEPNYLEFWVGKKNRLHERLTYKKINKETQPLLWEKQLLYP